jgi:hypothetical protein
MWARDKILLLPPPAHKTAIPFPDKPLWFLVYIDVDMLISGPGFGSQMWRKSPEPISAGPLVSWIHEGLTMEERALGPLTSM